MAKKEAGPEVAAAAPAQGRAGPARKGRKPGGPKKALTGRQKAAIFIITLGHEIAAEIFKHLRDDEIEQLTFEIARNEHIDSADRDQVLMEFQELMMAADFLSTGGTEYARELLERAVGSQKAVDIINRLTSSLQVRPFDLYGSVQYPDHVAHGMVVGSFYLHDEYYRATDVQASEWRGIVVLNEVEEGDFDPMFLSMNYLKRRFG